MAATPDYPRLKAPREDGQTLLWPAAEKLLSATAANSHLLRHDERVRLAGIPLGRVRAWQRRWLGHSENAQPLIATGHQSELYHPGVWAKNVVVDALAKRMQGAAIHFSVDTDSPKHLELRAPGLREAVTDDPARLTARWSGLLQAPAQDHVLKLQRLADAVETQWHFSPVARSFLQVLFELAPHHSELPAALANAHHQVDRELGLGHSLLVSSPLWRSTGYLLFVYDLLARADSFADAYNRALGEFRRRHGIVSPGRPMPDLPQGGEMCEVPFWLDFLQEGARKRAVVSRRGSAWALHAGGEVFEFSPTPARDGWAAAESLQEWLRRLKLRLSPRALSLTMFLRLCVVDHFVHGIGGGLYDQVTDAIIRSWYGMEPPAFSVATATLLFPSAAGRTPVCLGCLRSQGRALRNGALGPRKGELVQQIAAAPRRSLQRRQLFSQLHRELVGAAAASAAVAAWQARYQAAESRHEIEQAIFDREIPYVMQPTLRLESLILAVNRLFAP